MFNNFFANFYYKTLVNNKSFQIEGIIKISIKYLTLCCSDMFDPLENLTMVCKLAGVDALLIIAAELLFTSALGSFVISSGALNGCLSGNENNLNFNLLNHNGPFRRLHVCNLTAFAINGLSDSFELEPGLELL